VGHVCGVDLRVLRVWLLRVWLLQVWVLQVWVLQVWVLQVWVWLLLREWLWAMGRGRVEGVWPDRNSPLAVARQMPVGTDGRGPGLRLQAPQHVQSQRFSRVGHQALVDAAHARAASTGQHQACDVLAAMHGCRQPPM
jgi:hypothetical protein